MSWIEMILSCFFSFVELYFDNHYPLVRFYLLPGTVVFLFRSSTSYLWLLKPRTSDMLFALYIARLVQNSHGLEKLILHMKTRRIIDVSLLWSFYFLKCFSLEKKIWDIEWNSFLVLQGEYLNSYSDLGRLGIWRSILVWSNTHRLFIELLLGNTKTIDIGRSLGR